MNRLDNHQPLTSSKLIIHPSDVIAQTFDSHHDLLNIVSICLRNNGNLDQPLTFNLYENTTNKIRTIKFSSSNISASDCTRFQFEPIKDSQNKQYRAEIIYNPAVGIPSPYNTLSIETHSGDEFMSGTASVNSQPLPLDFHFKTYYFQTIHDAIQSTLTSYPSRIRGDISFMVFWLMLIIGVSALCLRK